jgi:hypothetical protein
MRRPRYIGQVVWGAVRRTGAPMGRVRRHPAVTVERPDLRTIDHPLWEAVQARRRVAGTNIVRTLLVWMTYSGGEESSLRV